ncbi:MAG TPA: hypothetical protein VGG84_01085 [Gemmatimonadaceae bacterium]|jgi:hypothetical protein
MTIAMELDHAAVFVAVVHAADGVRFAVSTDLEAELTHRLAEYVRARVDDVLWPDDATHVRTLLAVGDLMGAIECYFWHVGDRWDAEWLVTSRHPLVEQPAASPQDKGAS